MRRLLHRWFVQYNPIYLLSAALVLRGVNLLSRGMLDAGRAHAALGGPALAELYAWSLIGGAALLVRIGLRRPAVMLALLAVVYQGDLTLHTETCAWLGWIGVAASGVWLASFALKLVALAWAMQLRPSRSAYAVPMLGATGLVVMPFVMRWVSAPAASALVALWLFVTFGTALWTSRRIQSVAAIGAWGHVVLRRALLATWAMWGALALVHVGFWFSSRVMEPLVLLPAAALLVTRFVAKPWQLWLAIGSVVMLAGVSAPPLACLTATLGALAFAAHAPRDVRALAGSFVCTHLAIWTAGWSGGVLPHHLVALDVALVTIVLVFAWRLRARAALAPAAAILFHLGVQARVVTAPVTALEWGAWSVGVGFFLLVATLGASVVLHLQKRPLSESWNP